jgi:hypothetical protein
MSSWSPNEQRTVPLLLKVLGCAVVFGAVASVALFAVARPILNQLPHRRMKAAARRIGKDRIERIIEEARKAPPGTPESSEVRAFHEQIQGAADAAGRTMKRAIVVLIIAGWLLGAAVSWIVFYG